MVGPVQLAIDFALAIPPHRRNRPTSLGAALKLAPILSALHEDVLRTLANGPATPDECASMLDCHFMRVRPRFTQLAGEFYGWLIEQTDDTRPSALGNPQVVYRLSEHGWKYVGNMNKVGHATNGASDIRESANEKLERVS